MEAQSTAYHLPINLLAALVLLLLFLFGIGYAWFVRRLRHEHPDHGYTAGLVVGGDLVIAIGYGFLAGVDHALLLLACMAAAGLPMIIEYAGDHLNRRDGERRLDI